MAEAVFGLPKLPSVGDPLGGSSFDAGAGSGNNRNYTTFYPLKDATLVLVTVSNQHLSTNVRGMGASWLLSARADLPSGAFAESDTWIGYCSSPLPDNVVSVDYFGINVNAVAVIQLPGRRLRVMASAGYTHSGSGSLVATSLTATVAGIAIVTCLARVGTPATPSGYTELLRGAFAGAEVIAFKRVLAGEVVAPTWTGPTDNSGGSTILLAAGPSAGA